MRITIVVASAARGVIGNAGELAWRLADDLRHFSTLTRGGVVLMGRKTFASIGKPLPNRRNVVLSRGGGLPDTVEVFHDLPAALAWARAEGVGELFVIGGGDVYAQAWQFASRLYWTRVDADVVGDVFFLPDLDGWVMKRATRYEASERNEYAFSIEVWEK
jgi:dihydrofolate reductase